MKTINTTLGNITYNPIAGTIKTVIGGLWGNGDIDIVFYTSPSEESGIIATYNAKSNSLVKYRRIVQSFISSDSVKKYGRECVKETLPIYKA